MRTQLPFALIAAAVVCSHFISAADAAARDRVFVASYGNDANPCTFGSPCKTFQQAVSVVAAGGEVTAIDSAGFGPITITQAVTITSPNGVEAGIVPPANGDAITINAGASDVIQLHGLTVNGSGVGHNGITFNTGASLIIADCVIRNFGNEGIYFNPSASSTLRISDTLLDNNVDAGIWLLQSGSTTVTAAFERVEASNNHNGFVIEGSAAIGAVLYATIADSVATNNANAGMAAASATTTLMVFRSVVSNNNGVGLLAQGTGATLLVGQSTVTGNGIGWALLSGGTLQSYGDNKIDGNTTNQPPPALISNK